MAGTFALGGDSGRLDKAFPTGVATSFSAHMDPMLEAFEALAAGLTYAPPQVNIVSNRTGALADVVEWREWFDVLTRGGVLSP